MTRGDSSRAWPFPRPGPRPGRRPRPATLPQPFCVRCHRPAVWITYTGCRSGRRTPRGDQVKRRSSIGRVRASSVALATIMTACGSGRSSSSGDPDSSTQHRRHSGECRHVRLPERGVRARRRLRRHRHGRHRHRDHHRLRRRRRLPRQSPGLNHQMSDAVKAFISWCNDAGGINGRKVKGNYHDAKILDVNNAVTRRLPDRLLRGRRGLVARRLPGGDPPGLRSPGRRRLRGEPAVRQRPPQVGALPDPGRLHQRHRGALLKERFPDKVSKMAVDVRQLLGHHRLEGQGRERVDRPGLHASSTAPRSTTSRARPTGSRSSRS